ncbi:hypothetical protein [Duganella phyllosphaerae]|uniref:hypothetical protein n=1 Tax=Duganella phyllosphaerae TaxID=762836 RepID=UPI00114D25F9|nr:hypothetical protein [Duganella phyllosphaerae]
MRNLKNLSGKAGEFLCITKFMRATAEQHFLFDALLLGGNAKTPRTGTGYPTGFSATDVKRAQATKVPFFICAVDRSIAGSEKFFIKGVDAKRTRGINGSTVFTDSATAKMLTPDQRTSLSILPLTTTEEQEVISA